MSKNRDKNKKIKKRCPNCNKKNTFARENWKGAENTNCKYCGSKLNEMKTYKPPITKLNQSINKIKEKESFYEATRPSLNLCKAKSKMKTYILCSIAIIFILTIGFIYDNKDKNTLDKVNDYLNESNNLDLIPPIASKEFCSEIKGVPAWIQNNKIIDYGYKSNLNVSYLIDNKILFFYSAVCPACHKQIIEFGDQWGTYVLSGYVTECW